MIRLSVSIEKQGRQKDVGCISGETTESACFTYYDEYLEAPGSRPVSISLPLQKEAFSPKATKNFFEGLLPEGFTRKTVAGWLRTYENDYLSILSGLGSECIGAIK